VRLVGQQTRPRCFLVRLALDDGTRRRDVLVKVRHSVPEHRRHDLLPHRLVLTPERTLPDVEAARREYDGLRLAEQAVAAGESDRLGVLRPLAWLPELGGIVMDLVQEPTLRDRLLHSSRLQPRGRRRAPDPEPWQACGRWLRLFHECPTDLPLGERLTRREDLHPLFSDYADVLAQPDTGRLRLVDRCAAIARDAVADLPAELPLGTGHGDFVSRNVFCSDTGRVTVFDPQPLWRVPVHEDLARMAQVGLRLVDVQAVSQGAALASRHLQELEDALLDGYFGSDGLPVHATRLFQLLLLMDRWSDLVRKRSRGGGRARRTGRAALRTATELHYRREAERLASLLEAGR
jgi:hypothetical protein